MQNGFSARQKSVVLLCVTAYTAAYVCRLNLSAALGSIMDGMHLSMARAGMLQTLFAAIYACGQFVNGSIVDRVNPARHLLLGLLGTALCNLAMGMSASYPMLLIVWSLNAICQSMMWTPVMRLLAMFFSDNASRVRASEIIALMMIVGHFIAWAIAGFVSEMAGWRYCFILPAMIALLALLAAAPAARSLNLRDCCPASGADISDTGAIGKHPVFRVLLSTGFFPVLVTCVLYGFIRDSVITWTPTILQQLCKERSLSPTVFSLILPVINIAGVKTGFMLRRRGARAYSVVIIMMFTAILCSAPLAMNSSLLLTAILLALICAGMYGANTMLTGLIPLEYDRIGRTSLTAGMIDSFIYAGSALSGVLAGGVYETLGSHMLYFSWIAAGCLSAALMHIASRMSRAYWNTP